MNFTFLHYGKKRCPRCGSIGNRKIKIGIRFFECPKCFTMYTNEVVIATDDDEQKVENN